MDKKVVIITGASGGIGKETFDFLKEKGYVVYGISRSGVKTEFNYFADVNDFVKIKEIFSDIYKKEGRIDALINNAGFGIAGAIEYAKPENIYSMFNTNLSAVASLSSMVIPYLKETKGNIINISSVGGAIPLPFQACYSASKAGVSNFSKALRMELKEFGIKVSVVLPGDTRTGFTAARVIDKSDSNSYSSRDEKSIQKMAKDEQKGKDPKTVAKVIFKLLKKKNPPAQKTVGFSYKLIVLLVKLLPECMVNKIVKKIYG